VSSPQLSLLASLPPPPLVSKMDAVAWLKSMRPESVDLVITDPAYESLEKHRAVGTTTRLTGAWFEIFPNRRFPEFFAELYRVLKPSTHCYVMCDPETAFVIKPMGEAAGFKFWKPLVWSKLSMGMGYHYRAKFEFVMFFEKGSRQLNDLGVCDVLEFKRVRGGYPTEKPVELCEVLVTQSSQPGELVIDPFMGSGSAGVAALRNGRLFAGSDIAEASIKLATERLATAEKQGKAHEDYQKCKA
jgi:site-specific DNA-methyltransferase (adenine-specific)